MYLTLIRPETMQIELLHGVLIEADSVDPQHPIVRYLVVN